MNVELKRWLTKVKMAKEARRGKVKPLWDVDGRGQGFSILSMQGPLRKFPIGSYKNSDRKFVFL